MNLLHRLDVLHLSRGDGQQLPKKEEGIRVRLCLVAAKMVTRQQGNIILGVV